jgi:hypothetical protein
MALSKNKYMRDHLTTEYSVLKVLKIKKEKWRS